MNISHGTEGVLNKTNDEKPRENHKRNILWEHLEIKYNLKGNKLNELQRDLCTNNRKTTNNKKHHEKSEEEEEGEEHSLTDRHFVLMKWFYFVTTCTTTIGYGHVHPKTDEGKLFYIFFSIFGIAVMIYIIYIYIIYYIIYYIYYSEQHDIVSASSLVDISLCW